MQNKYLVDLLDHSRRLTKYFFYSFQSFPLKKIKLKDISCKNKEKIFIFGTGKSILELTEQHFEYIKRYFSIGLNFFVLHDFIPNIYMFEYMIDKVRFEIWRKAVEKKLRLIKIYYF